MDLDSSTTERHVVELQRNYVIMEERLKEVESFIQKAFTADKQNGNRMFPERPLIPVKTIKDAVDACGMTKTRIHEIAGLDPKTVKQAFDKEQASTRKAWPRLNMFYRLVFKLIAVWPEEVSMPASGSTTVCRIINDGNSAQIYRIVTPSSSYRLKPLRGILQPGEFQLISVDRLAGPPGKSDIIVESAMLSHVVVDLQKSTLLQADRRSIRLKCHNVLLYCLISYTRTI